MNDAQRKKSLAKFKKFKKTPVYRGLKQIIKKLSKE